MSGTKSLFCHYCSVINMGAGLNDNAKSPDRAKHAFWIGGFSFSNILPVVSLFLCQTHMATCCIVHFEFRYFSVGTQGFIEQTIS